MAAIIHKKQTVGAATATLAITSATKGNLLVALINQKSTTAAPTGKDNLGTTGWTVHATHAIFFTSVNSLYVAYKTAAGGETELNPTAGAGGTIQGISYFEIEGLSETVDAITHKDNIAAAKTATSEAITTTDAGDVILACLATAFEGSGTVSAWTGTGPMANVETTTTRCIGGSLIPAATESAVTFTANWTSSVQTGMLVVAFKPTSETKTVTALVHGAGLSAVSALKIALATAAVTGAGATKASVSKTASITALVHGAGNATATIGTVEVRTVIALVHGAGRATVTALHVGLVNAKVTGAGAATVTSRKVAVTTAAVTGGGLAKVSAHKIALVTGNVTGAGRATVTISSGGPINPCLMTIHNGKVVAMTIINQKAAHHVIVNRKASQQTVVNL